MGRKTAAKEKESCTVALAGNPNVGKSTVFNALTGLHQHTGNWPGKTVACAQGRCRTERHTCTLVDLPGTYSLMAHSAEEEIARDYLCSGSADAVIVVCDATCLERNLNLVLQTLEITRNVIVCVNLMDEAKRKKIKIDLKLLSERLGVPVVGTSARKRKSLAPLTEALDAVLDGGAGPGPAFRVQYPAPVEAAAAALTPLLREQTGDALPARRTALQLLGGDAALPAAADAALREALGAARARLAEQGLAGPAFRDAVASSLVSAAESVCAGAVTHTGTAYRAADARLDRLLTSRLTGYPVMLALLALSLWLTIVGANYPSALLSDALFRLQGKLTALFAAAGAPEWLHGLLVLGVYRVLAWVVSVMLPPMAIFFPLFTLLEDAGYLPRVAYNLDRPFRRCSACGKQALTMCMGFGCNAAGVIGCRIIDSGRERLLAVLTNNLVPCNGRFPTLIALASMFLIGTADGAAASVRAALLLTGVIVLGVVLTFAVTKWISRTLLRGMPSSFTLELPPYRPPQPGRVIVRSVFDRTLFVLGRAVVVAAPAGLLLWVMANVSSGGVSLLDHCAAFLDPFARCMGLDGVILIAFILGFPANEIVIPIILMAYLSQGTILALESLDAMRELFVAHGWTWVTAACTMLFTLLHWPCSTTVLTIRRETGSWKWALLSMAIPTVLGILACAAFNAAARCFL